MRQRPVRPYASGDRAWNRPLGRMMDRGVIRASYSYRDGQGDVTGDTEQLGSYRELEALFARYPWEVEAEPLGDDEAGGGLFFRTGDTARFASYQFVPLERDRGWLDFEVVARPGWIKLFGRRAAHVDFGIVSIAEAQHRIRELFDYGIDALYDKHRRR